MTTISNMQLGISILAIIVAMVGWLSVQIRALGTRINDSNKRIDDVRDDLKKIKSDIRMLLTHELGTLPPSTSASGR